MFYLILVRKCSVTSQQMLHKFNLLKIIAITKICVSVLTLSNLAVLVIQFNTFMFFFIVIIIIINQLFLIYVFQNSVLPLSTFIFYFLLNLLFNCYGCIELKGLHCLGPNLFLTFVWQTIELN